MIGDDVRDASAALLDQAPCAVVLPAGCGKTQLAAGTAAVAATRNKRVLVLTHTHAGVDAIRRRMRTFQVPSNAAKVSTIDHWTQRLVVAFPQLSGYVPAPDVVWPDVHRATARLLGNRHIREMLRATYDFAVIDEYQDCSKAQHAVVTALFHLMQVVILGDPHQAIYNFRDNDLVEWTSDLGHVRHVELALRPWRWVGANEDLGTYLLAMRARLTQGQSIDLRTTALTWREDTPQNRRTVCWEAVDHDGSIVILDRFSAQCVSTARMLSGRFGVMEEMEGSYLLGAATVVAQGNGPAASAALLRFARGCFASLPATLTKKMADEIERGPFPRYIRTASAGRLMQALEAVAQEPAPERVLAALREVERLEATVVRREAWRDMLRAAKRWAEVASASLPDAVRAVRDQARMYGRKQERRTVSRVVLVKGQEFDECIVLGADALNARELYVAMTRPRHRLTVLSRSPLLTPKP